MSLVTNLILTWPCDGYGTQPSPFLQAVNAHFEGKPGLVHVDSVQNGDWYGGTKYLEVEVAIGAINYLDLDAFMAHLRTVPWERPEHVQLMVCEQEDPGFRIITL